jgi:putative phosphoesterase
MLIGILSDTHNDIEMTRKALDAFHERGVSMLIHAGDLVAPEMVDLFDEFKVRFVLGNNDVDHEGIMSACRCTGNDPATRCCSFEIEKKKFFVCHGDDTGRYTEAVESGKYDYVIFGHTHVFSARHRRNTLVINPGAVMRDKHPDFEQSCVVLDVRTGEYERILLLDEPGNPDID